MLLTDNELLRWITLDELILSVDLYLMNDKIALVRNENKYIKMK